MGRVLAWLILILKTVFLKTVVAHRSAWPKLTGTTQVYKEEQRASALNQHVLFCAYIKK